MTIVQYLSKINDLLCRSIGKKVEHLTYGIGYIKSLEAENVIVKFDELDEFKVFRKENFFKFNYPVDEDLITEYQAINCEYELSKNIKQEDRSNNISAPIIKSDKITFDDVIGLDNVKDEVNRLIVYPFKYQEIYRAFKRKSGGGILLYGAPGCGKTMIVKAIANEVNAKLFVVKCSDIKSKWYGQSEQKIRDIFNEARMHHKSIIFFDEFDALGVNRDKDDSKIDKNIVAELLTQIDGFDSKDSKNTLLLIAATNKPWNIDSALIRNGRFGKKIYVGLPTNDVVTRIIKHELSDLPIEEIDFNEISADLDNMSPADIVALCNEAKDLAIKRSIENSAISPINKLDLINAKDIIKSTINVNELKRLENFSI